MALVWIIDVVVQYVKILGGRQKVPAVVRIAAWLLLVAAALLTVLLHAGYVVWLGLAYLRGLHIANCGCFGVFWARPLTPWMFLEDGALLAAAAILYFGVRRATRAGRSAKRSA